MHTDQEGRMQLSLSADNRKSNGIYINTKTPRISEFSKVAGNKINTRKSTFLNTNNEHVETKIETTIYNQSKKMKYLGTHLKYARDLYVKNYKC